MPEPTYWNGKPCPCRRLRVRLPDSYDGPATRPWFEHLLGQEIDAVDVDGSFLLANDDGSGWAKVTEGRGSPYFGHRSLPNDSVEAPDA